MFNQQQKEGNVVTAPIKPESISTGFTVKLSKPITTHSGTLHELKFKALTAEILIRHRSLPFAYVTHSDGSQEAKVDFATAAKFISDLTGHDEIVLGQLTPGDFGKCVQKIVDLLGEAGN